MPSLICENQLVVKVHGVHIQITNNQQILMNIMMDIYPNNLKAILFDPNKKQNLNYQQKVKIAQQITQTLSDLHAQNVLHLDIKPENILLDANLTPFFTDFGLTKFGSETVQTIVAGYSQRYSPYEQMASETISPKSDVWSMGVLLYEMFSQKEAWKTISNNVVSVQLFDQMSNQKKSFFQIINPQSKQLIHTLDQSYAQIQQILEKCLKFEFSERIGSKELAAEFNKI